MVAQGLPGAGDGGDNGGILVISARHKASPDPKREEIYPMTEGAAYSTDMAGIVDCHLRRKSTTNMLRLQCLLDTEVGNWVQGFWCSGNASGLVI